MSEKGREQGTVVPSPCLYMKAESQSIYTLQLLPPWRGRGAIGAQNALLDFCFQKYLPTLRRGRAGNFCKLVFPVI